MLQELIRDLSAPIKSFRVFALERVIQEGNSTDLLDVLRATQARETDEECLILFGHAIDTLNQRLTAGKTQVNNTSAAEWKTAFESSAAAAKLDLLVRLPETRKTELAAFAPTWVQAEQDPIILAALIRTFGSRWPVPSIQILSRFLFSRFLSVSLATLEALIQVCPQALERGLPRFLASPDPRVWGLAIRGLAQINPDEALEHLEAMLWSAETRDKACGMQLALYLPFVRLKPVLLKFLSVEQDLDLLTQAGALLEINPDQEVPFRLSELIIQAPPEKAKLLEKTWKGACRALQASGLLGEKTTEYFQKLEGWREKLNAVYLLRNLVSPFLTQESAAGLDLSPLEALKTEQQTWVIEESAKWGFPEHIRKALQGFGEPKASSGKPASPDRDPFDLKGLTLEEGIRLMATWKPEETERSRLALQELISAPQGPAEMTAAVLRTALRLGISSFCSQARENLRCSDEQVVAEALKYLSCFEPDTVFPILGHYLQSSSIRLKTTALRILKQFDARQALSMVQALLQSRQTARQSAAIACMMNFDFPLVRPMLAEFLSQDPPPEILQMALTLFVSNPDPENPFFLFRLERSASPEQAPAIAAARSQCEKALVGLGLWPAPSGATQMAAWEARIRQDEARKRVPPSPCSVLRSRHRSFAEEIRVGGIRAGAAYLFDEIRERPGFLRQTILGGMIVVSMLLVVLNYEAPSAEFKNPRRGPLLAVPLKVTGTVRSRNDVSGLLDCISEDGLEFLLPEDGVLPRLRTGDRFYGEILPFRYNSAGKVIAQKRLLVRR